MEALELGIEDLELMRQWKVAKAKRPSSARPQRNPVYLALGDVSAEQHVLNVVQKISPAALQDALLVLPFSQVCNLFTFLDIWACREWNVPLTCRVLLFMLKIHHRQIIASKTMRPMLDGIRETLRRVLGRQKDEMGFNLAGLRFIAAQVREQGTREYVDEDTWEQQQQNLASGKKRSFIQIS